MYGKFVAKKKKKNAIIGSEKVWIDVSISGLLMWIIQMLKTIEIF